MPETGITIYFVGICTHIINDPQVDENIDAPHRVVLVDPGGAVTINDKSIPQHIATLKKLSGDFVNAESFDSHPEQMVMSIQGAGSGTPVYDATWSQVPNLLNFVRGAALQLSGDVVAGQAAPANVYFDVHQGTFSAGRVDTGVESCKQPIGVALHIEVEGNPTLLISQFGASTSPVSVVFTPGTILQLSNEATSASDSTDDFLLHFKNFESIPGTASVPKCTNPDLQLFTDADPSHDLTTGCSNSTYP